MGRSFHRATPEADGKDFQSFKSFYSRTSDRYYRGVLRGNVLFQVRHQLGFKGKESNVLEKKVDYVVGSGNHARTYLSRTPDGRLVELPVSWYAEKGGTWAMSPGFDRPDQEDFRRTIPYECMFCHNGYPAKQASGFPAAKPVFDANLPEGIDCQRCHGPGSAHLAALQSGHASRDEVRAAIVNPARLSRDRQMEVCMQCHLESSSRPLPYSVRRYDRSVFSYRPGEPLNDYAIHFDRKPTPDPNRFEIAGAAYRLRQSACFRNSQMTCLTCHDPHKIPRGVEAKAHYASVCRTCHTSSTHVTAMSSAAESCLDCHMPKRPTQDAVHVVMTDHFIQRRKPAGDLLAPLQEPSDPQAPYRGEVVPYYPQPLATSPENDLYRAVAQVKDEANLAGGIPALQQAIEKYKPKRPEFYFELGKAYVKQADPTAAIHSLEEALRRQPDFAPARGELVLALFAAGQVERAAEVIHEAQTRSEPDAVLLTNLGNAYLQTGMSDRAEEPITEAIKLNPDLADAHNLLGLARLQKGDRTSAEQEFREAIRIQPELALAHYNLANLLAESHNYPEAQYHFEKAIGLDRNYAAAHHRYALLLELVGGYDKALVELRNALRLDPTLADAHNELGDLLAAKGQVQTASDEYEEAIRLKSDLYEAHLSLGTILAKRGEFQKARQHFDAASHSTDPAVRDPALRAMSGQAGRTAP